jgi:Fe-S-cluster-containing dehydrogenase component
LACPFGIPKMMEPEQQMMKCDMCYDRTSVGKRPMCATVCPSQQKCPLGSGDQGDL